MRASARAIRGVPDLSVPLTYGVAQRSASPAVGGVHDGAELQQGVGETQVAHGCGHVQGRPERNVSRCC
eukprot:326570-Pleurochrysis_carterae.AAC.2